jgi:hypothetical protein
MAVHLVNPSHVSFGIGVITRRLFTAGPLPSLQRSGSSPLAGSLGGHP